jgi:hypothetical protein
LIIFSDSDVALPYVLDRVKTEEASGHCAVLRPTVVSPVNMPDLSNKCSVLLVQEWQRYGESAPTAKGPRALTFVGSHNQQDLVAAEHLSQNHRSPSKLEGGWLGDLSQWHEEQRWSSSTGLFHFSTYRNSHCGEISP